MKTKTVLHSKRLLGIISEDNADGVRLLQNCHPPAWVNPKPLEKYDLIVVGGGAAGMTAATFAAEQGAKVALIEKDLLGGECFNVGCIPSKAIVRTARLYADMRNAANFGGEVPAKIDVNFALVMERARHIRAQISGHISVEMLSKKKIDIFFGHAQFSGKNNLLLGGLSLKFRKAIVATGSRPIIPDIPGLHDIEFMTNETVFNLKTLPQKLLIIGGGSIGCELAQTFARLGSQVTIVQDDPMFLNNVERDGAQILSSSLAEDGVNIHLNSTVSNIKKSGRNKVITIVTDDRTDTVQATNILVSVGQKPETASLMLEAANIKSTPEGPITIDKYFMTDNPHVYAVGTVCEGQMSSHIPVESARCAAMNALYGNKHTLNEMNVPWCIYTDPEVAHIGLQVKEARELNVPIKTFNVLMHQIDRAVADGEDIGFVKIHVKEGTDKILGATIVARHAGDIMNGVSLAMSANIGLIKLGDAYYPYPTQGEAIKAAGMACFRSLNPLGPNKKRKSLRHSKVKR